MHSMLAQVIFDDLRPATRSGQPPGTIAQVEANAVREQGLNRSRIGLASPMTFAAAHLDQLRGLLPDVTWADGGMALMKPRAVKSAAEVALMRRAAELSGIGLRAAQDAVRPGVTERAVANAAQAAMFTAGAERLGFDTAVVAGPRAGLKHGDPTDRAMVEGDLVFLDMGAVVSGYHADLSRCVGVGHISGEQQRFLDAGKRMFEAALAAVKPGAAVADLYRTASRVAEETGFSADYQANGLGHGLGLSLFELPALIPDSPLFHAPENVLQPGMIFALEPMLVRYDYGTAVVEETVLVTADGGEPLSGLEW
jgi:Xaa-Pro dipeptidase